MLQCFSNFVKRFEGAINSMLFVIKKTFSPPELFALRFNQGKDICNADDAGGIGSGIHGDSVWLYG
jgi:hypothetical protein